MAYIPSAVMMRRGTGYEDVASLKTKGTERHPGDGMEANLVLTHQPSCGANAPIKNNLPDVQESSAPVSPKLNSNKIVDEQEEQEENDETPALATTTTITTTKVDDRGALVLHSEEDVYVTKAQMEMNITIESLKTKLNMFEEQNDKIIEEKMRLSHQLGVQTQVNNELKRLLVASIGDDMEAKYERMLHDKHLADVELRHLHDILQDDREEVEQALIQADVWRSKFLASRVMSEELTRWKSVLYYKYRDTHTALQNLLEEHSKIRALNEETRTTLVDVIDMLGSKDPSLDVDKSLSTMDVAYMNNDLVKSICEVMAMDYQKVVQTQIHHSQNDANNSCEDKSDINVQNLLNDNIVPIPPPTRASPVLTAAECVAQSVVLNPGVQSDELTRMRNDYLAHNRISHFLSTNYQVTFNCCVNCKGMMEMI